MHYLDQMHSGQQHLLHLWTIKKTKLEQCLQLRVFEQDCEKVMIDKSLFLIGIMIVIAAIIANHATNLEMCFFTIPGYKQFLNFSAAAAPGSLSVVTLQVNLAINMFLCSGREFFVIYTDETDGIN